MEKENINLRSNLIFRNTFLKVRNYRTHNAEVARMKSSVVHCLLIGRQFERELPIFCANIPISVPVTYLPGSFN